MKKPRIYLKSYVWNSFWAVDRGNVPWKRLTDSEKKALQKAHAFKNLLQARLNVARAERELIRIEKEFKDNAKV